MAIKNMNEAKAALEAAKAKKAAEGVFGEKGGKSPSFSMGMAKHIQAAPSLLGQKSLLGVLGSGLNDDNSQPSVNLRSKSLPRSVDRDVCEALLELKKHLHSAMVQASLISHANKCYVNIQEVPFFKAHVAPLLKAYNVTDFADWIPTLNTRFYFEELEIDPGLSGLFPQHNMTSAIQEVPTISGRLMGELETDTGTFTEQSETDGKIQLATRNCVAHVKITEDLISDSDPSVFDRLRGQVAKGIIRSIDNALLNGDTTNPHMDADVVGAKDYRKAWKGLRKIALDNASAVYNHAGARPNFTLFQEMFKLMGKARYDRGDCLWLLSLAVEGDTVSGKIPEILTVDKAGSNATIFSGMMPNILGIKPVISEWIREDLAATALYTVPGQTLTVSHLIRLSGFLFGQRSPMRIWAAPSLPSSDVMLMSAKNRVAFGGAANTASDKYVVLGRNIATQ
jgi:hypothetical protein